ncbi:MAG: hypothetical protein WA682_09245, partial [Acidobacteriaceae bacterium]
MPVFSIEKCTDQGCEFFRLLEWSVMAGVFDEMKFRIARLVDYHAHLGRGTALVFTSCHNT